MAMASPEITKILERPQPQIEDLLNEEDLIQEYKSKNEKLLKFLGNEEVIKKLIDFIKYEPPDDSELRGHKFPFFASQLLSIEQSEIMGKFLMTELELEKEKEAQEIRREGELSVNAEKFFGKEEENCEEFGNVRDFKEVNVESEEEEKNVKEKSEKNKEEEENVKIEENNKNENKEEEQKKDNNNNIETEENINTKNKVEILDSETIESQEKSADIQILKDMSPKKENARYNNYSSENKSASNTNKKYDNTKYMLLDYALDFVKSDKELNYVLCGYFSSLINTLINMQPLKIINYIFNVRPDCLEDMVKHSYRKSICELLTKLLYFENFISSIDENPDETSFFPNVKEMKQKRLKIFELLFKDFNIKSEPERNSNFISAMADILENKKVFEEILEDKNIINYLIIDNLKDIDLTNTSEILPAEEISKKRQNFSYILDFLIQLLSNIKTHECKTPMIVYEVEEDLVEQGQERSQGKVVQTPLSEAFLSILENLITTNFCTKTSNSDSEQKILASYNDKSFVPLGIYKIKIVEFLGNLVPYFKGISEEFDKLLVRSKFFEVAFEYLFEYEWNNMYQDALLNLFKKILTESSSHEFLAGYLFEKLKLIEIIKNHVEDGNSAVLRSRRESEIKSENERNLISGELKESEENINTINSINTNELKFSGEKMQSSVSKSDENIEKNMRLNKHKHIVSATLSPVKSAELKIENLNQSSGFKTPKAGKSISDEDRVNQSVSVNVQASNASLISSKAKFKFNLTGNSTPHGYYPFLVSLSYKINSIIGGTPLKLNNTYSREGSISFMTRSRHPELGNENAFCSLYGLGADFYDCKEKDKEDKSKEVNIFIVESMRKYLTQRWCKFFDSSIADKVKLFEKKLGEEETKKENENLDSFNQVEINNEEEEDVNKNEGQKNLDFFAEIDNEKEGENDLWEENNKIEEKEVEVNLNEFEFEGEKNEKKNNLNGEEQKVIVDELDDEKLNKKYNDKNYWDSFKEHKGYVDVVGEEAMKELEGL